MVELQENGDILHDGELVGYLGWNDNTLVDISIEERHQNNGYATAAVSQLVTILQSEGYDEVTTTTVVSGAMETVLRRNSFEPEPPQPVFDPEDYDGVDEGDIPTERTGVWRRPL